MMTRVKKPYTLEKGRCDFCGHITRVELYYHTKHKRLKYACKECSKVLEDEWVSKRSWDDMLDYASYMAEEDWDEDWGYPW